MKRWWWCMECQAEVELDKHGRCDTCVSEAVTSVWTKGDVSRPVSVGCAESASASACI